MICVVPLDFPSMRDWYWVEASDIEPYAVVFVEEKKEGEKP
jgi:hypothetical protein